MKRGFRVRLTAALLALPWVGAPALRGADDVRQPDHFARNELGLTKQELLAVADRRIVTKVVESADPSEVAVVGMLRLTLPAEVFLSAATDLETYRADTVTKLERIGQPPRLDDFDDFGLGDADVESLRTCRPGDCLVKLSATAMQRLRDEVEWSSGTPTGAVNRLLRPMALAYVESYLKGGIEALATYQDKEQPVRVAEMLRGVLEQARYLYTYERPFFDYLLNYPEATLAGTRDFLYWSEESFGRKPTLTLNHVTVWQPPPGQLYSAVVAVKQIYASHYFRAGLSLTALVPESGPGARRVSYLLRIDRVRADDVANPWEDLRRAQFEQALRARSEASLQAQREALRAAVAPR